jgi:hypothetical protein
LPTAPCARAAGGASSGFSALAENGNASIVTGGLRRTPLSGGVQSATVKHDLPAPAVAVRNLMEQAQYAHLCTVMSRMHHRRAGYPFGSLVDFATDAGGAPLLALSPLAIHTRNALAEPRCSLVVQMPGWSGLANARVTIFGDLVQLAPESAEAIAAAEALRAKHAPPPAPGAPADERRAGAALLGNFLYFRCVHARGREKSASHCIAKKTAVVEPSGRFLRHFRQMRPHFDAFFPASSPQHGAHHGHLLRGRLRHGAVG